MTDELDRYGGHDPETWRVMMDRRMEILSDHRREVASYAHRISAWMIGQLFVANAGAITLTADRGDPIALSLFVSGILAAMACSLCAWRQSHISYHETVQLSDPAVYTGMDALRQDETPPKSKETLWFMAAVAFGIGSLLAFAAGAMLSIWA